MAFIQRQRVSGASRRVVATGGSASSEAPLPALPTQVEFDHTRDHEADAEEEDAHTVSSTSGSKRGREAADRDEEFEHMDAAEESAYQLPLGFPQGMRIRYALFAMGESGMARFYAKSHQGSIFTCGKDTVWTFDDATGLWGKIDYNLWVISMQQWLINRISPVIQYISPMVATAEAEGDKEAAKAPKSWLGRMSKVFESICKLRNAKDTAKIAFLDPHLFDDSIVERLDANPLIYSFANSVVELVRRPEDGLFTAKERARTREDMISFALSFDFADANSEQALYYDGQMKYFLRTMYEDDEESLDAMQVTLGYFSTGLRKEKRIWSIFARTDSGKTTLFSIVANAMEKYAVTSGIPVDELLESCGFSGALAQALSKNPPPRLVCFDEIRRKLGGAMLLNENLANNLANGKVDGGVALNIKHGEAIAIKQLMAKLVMLVNSPLTIPSQSTGLANRVTNIGLTVSFPEVYDAASAAPYERPRDPALEARLTSKDAKLGIMRFLIRGALRYLNGRSIMSVRMLKSTFETRVLGDPYLSWLTKNFLPTGIATDRITLEGIVENFRSAGHSSVLNNNALENLHVLLDSFGDFAERIAMADQWGRIQQGYTGIRGRLLEDPDWFEGRRAAALTKASLRT